VRRKELKAKGGEGVGEVDETWEGVIFCFFGSPCRPEIPENQKFIKFFLPCLQA
jgi:hypothetical protein